MADTKAKGTLTLKNMQLDEFEVHEYFSKVKLVNCTIDSLVLNETRKLVLKNSKVPIIVGTIGEVIEK